MSARGFLKELQERLWQARADQEVRSIPPREFFRIVGRAFGVSYRARTRASTIVSILGFALALLPMLISVTLRSFADAVQGLFEGTVGLSFVFGTLGLLVSLYLVKQLYDAVRSYYASVDTELIIRYLKESILRCTCSVKMMHIDNHDDFAEKVAFADSYAGEQVARSMQEVALWLQNAVSLVALGVVLAGVNPLLIVVIVATCLPGIVVSYRQERETYLLAKGWSRVSAFIHLYYQDCTRFQCLQELRFQRMFPFIKKSKWRPSVDSFVNANSALIRKHTIINCLADLFRGSVYIIILAMTVQEIYQDPTMGLGVFMLVISAAGQMQNLTTQLFFGASQFVAHVRYMKDFFDLDELERERTDAGAQTPAHADIRFRDVSFAYPDSSTSVLKNVNVTIREGEKVAIVGRNGSGKSTFVNLLCALYDPQQGSVCIGDTEVSKNPTGIRKTISAVFQDFGRYEDTIRFNVAISDLKRECSDEEIMALCESAGAASFIKELDDGLDEAVGSYSEGGNNLSGGQWQRLAIVRAVHRVDARIMVLDEPTSALDPLAEANIYRNFADLVGDRTAIFISHRLGITSLVDRVLVFDDGRIVEDGTHEELLERDGLYAELYRSQAQWYQ